ncbi:MAG: Na/Pi cotransporter family protein [Proteobacteria bacterium]|nr:Na/Pi cotransporter family protein [Pseudomonadota bacterium]
MIETPQQINWILLIAGLLGGLSLFLYGLDKMGNTLRYLSGYKVKKLITKLTKNRISSLFTGIILTAMMQSSSATMVLLVGFVYAEMLTLSQTLGVILGADIGTTLTVQLIAFKVTKYALIPVSLGFFIKSFAKDELLENIGRSLLGFGLLFYGIELMSISMSPLKNHAPFINIISEVSNPIYGILIGAMFTAAIQSSAASLAIILALAGQGLIDVSSGLGLMLGVNIGTCVTAVLACIGKNRAAERVAAAHVFFKISSVLLVFPFLSEFESFVRFVSPFKEGSKIIMPVSGVIANSHFVFNAFVAILFLPFTPIVAKLLTKLLPDKEVSTAMKVKYITDDAFDSPGLALTQARREIYRMGIYVEKMLEQSLPAIQAKNKKLLNELQKEDEFIDFLYKEITTFLIRLNRLELSTEQSQDLIILTKIVADLESIGDLLERNVSDIGKKIIAEDLKPNEELKTDIEKVFTLIKQTFTLTLISINHPNEDVLKDVENKKPYLKRLTNRLNNGKLEISKGNTGQLKVYSTYEDLADIFSRIFYYSRKVAKNLQKQESTDEQKAE